MVQNYPGDLAEGREPRVDFLADKLEDFLRGALEILDAVPGLGFQVVDDLLLELDEGGQTAAFADDQRLGDEG